MAWVPYAELGTSLLGGMKNSKGQQAAGNAASQAFTAEEQAIGQLLSQYFANAPAFLNQEKGLMGSLQDFPATQQPEIQQLANTMGASDTSLLNTLRSQLGGAANPAALLGSLQEGNRQSEMQNTQGMQAQLAGQNLQALSEQGSVLSTLGQFLDAPVAAGLGGLQGIGQTYLGSAQAGGNPWASFISSLGNFAATQAPKSTATPAATPSGGANLANAGAAIGTIPMNWSNTTMQNTNPYSNSSAQWDSTPPAFGY